MKNKRFLTRPDECFCPSVYLVLQFSLLGKENKAQPCELIPASLLIMVAIIQANGLALCYLLRGDGGLIFCADKPAVER